MSAKIPIDRAQIAAFCQRWNVTELSLFGPVLQEDFRPGDEVDMLVAFAPDARRDLFDLMRMENELTEILDGSVDLVERAAVERSEDTLRRRQILEAEPVYLA